MADEGVFTLSSSAVINAPREKVWKVLFDFPAYKEWNSFIRSQAQLDKSKKPLADQAAPLKVGSRLRLDVHIPPTMDDSASLKHSDVFVTEYDRALFRIAWRAVPPMPGTLYAERWQQLTEAEDGKTKYETREVFRGPLAYIVRWMMRDKLQLCLNALANDLKTRSEAVV